MSGKRGQGPGDNPWVRQTEPGPEDSGPGPALPPSPWSQEVPPYPGPGGPEGPAGPGPGTEGDGPVAWGAQISPPSLRRPAPEPKRRFPPPLLLPIGAAAVVLALVAVGLVVLLGGDEPEARPTPTPPVTTSAAPSPTPTYTPPANAIAVGFGVSVVPVDGWTVFTKEKQGKQLISPDPSGKARASFWVRQRQGLTAETYLLRIVEGETAAMVAQLGEVRRNLPCPRDVLVECAAITYTATAKNGLKLQGFVETYRRKDGLVTGIDFQSRVDYAPKAAADAQIMRKSVIDSL